MIVKAEEGDFSEIAAIYIAAREFMIKNGNPTQWGEVYPQAEIIKNDILNKRLYVVKRNYKICGVFYFNIENDPTYSVIYNGEWQSNLEYGVIHRVASLENYKGVFCEILEFCKKKIGHLRIDTHENNTVMRHLLLKNGFKNTGIIHIENGDERYAFELI